MLDLGAEEVEASVAAASGKKISSLLYTAVSLQSLDQLLRRTFEGGEGQRTGRGRIAFLRTKVDLSRSKSRRPL